MIKLATCTRKCEDFSFQLILNENGLVIGVNLLCENKILIKKRFDSVVPINSKKDELRLVNEVIFSTFSK